MGRSKIDEKDKAKPNDRIVCEICSLEYTRSNKSKHLKSKFHMMTEKLVTATERKEHSVGNILKHRQKGGSRFSKEKRSRKIISDESSDSESGSESRKYDGHENSSFASKISDELNDYITENYGQIFVKNEYKSFLLDPNLSFDKKTDLVDRIANSQNKFKNRQNIYDIDNNVENNNGNLYEGSAAEIQERVRKLGKF